MEDKNIIKTIENLKRKLLDQQNLENLMNLLVALEENRSADIEHLVADLTLDYKSGNFVIKPEKGRQSNTQKISEKQLGWLTSRMGVYYDPEGPQQKYSNKKNLESRLKVLAKKMNGYTKNELIHQFSSTVIELERLIQDLQAREEENKFLSDYFKGHQSRRKQAVSNQTAGLERKYKSNNQCMQECLDEILNEGDEGQELSKKIYKRFCTRVRKKFRNPPFVQKLRQNKEEKLQDPATQKIDLEATERDEWAPSTLWYFFEKRLKVKIRDLP